MYGVAYSVDIVMCIDATGSMQHLIDQVKRNALRFYEDLVKVMTHKQKTIDSLRVKVIAFRDFYVDGDRSLKVSPFYKLPEESEAFAAFVKGIKADGGGDEPETSLEALALALKSEWLDVVDTAKGRQVVVMWTDTSAHPLERQREAKSPVYPSGLPGDFNGLTDWWEGGSHVTTQAKRLLVYAPDVYPWNNIAEHWSNTVHYPSQAGNGLETVDYSAILDAIANTLGA